MRKDAEVPASAVFDRLSSARPAVGREDRSWGFMLGLGGVAVLGVIVFLSLSAGRDAKAQTSPPVQPVVAQATVPPPSSSYDTVPSRPVPVLPSTTTADPRPQFGSPAMVVDLSEAQGGVAGPVAPGAARPGTVPAATPRNEGGSGFAEDQFVSHVTGSQPDTVLASHLNNVALVVPQGTVIPAVLETAINSDLPGFVRAVVSRDVHGFDGSTILIPRGSKLIGQYRNAVAVGASRAFVVWSRLLTPDGVSVDLGSPAADELGRGGLEGETNSHFFQRFGAAILLSVLSAGTEALASANTSGNTAIIIGSPQQATNVAAIALQKDIDIPTTITVPQGAPMRVFVVRDLDFSAVVRRQP